MSSAIHKLLATEVVEVHQEACKNYRNKTVACQQCIDSCSEKAISLQNQIPVITDTKCIDCGACVSVCPVNAIDHLRKPYGMIAKYVYNYPQAEITCGRVEEFNRGIKIPCLLYLDVPLISQYADRREELHIYTGHCQSCEKIAKEKILKHLEQLERRLEALGIIFKIRTTEQLPENNSEQTVDAVSRRDLFKKFSLTSIREFLLPSRKSDDEPLSDQEYESLSISDRMHIKKRLLNRLNESDKSINEGAQINNFSFLVNENCNGCNVCERICPTKALYWEANDKTSSLVFNSSLCVECNKCLACPVDAIVKVPFSQEEIQTEQELISMELIDCVDCGETFKSSNENETTCFFCKAKSEKDPMRFFTS